ncbi:hypothetical protein ABIF90_008907 [Bradyrhizobium japonicum]
MGRGDLAELGRLRHYLIFGRKDNRAHREKLMKAIDDYVEEMTGDWTWLHAQNHKWLKNRWQIGPRALGAAPKSIS